MNRTLALASVLILLIIPTIPVIHANPIPSDLPYASNWGGDPVPVDDDPEYYLEEERIVADIDKEKAKVKAFYTFQNPTGKKMDVAISLPFREEPDSIGIYLDEVELTCIKGYFNHEFPDKTDGHYEDVDLYMGIPSYSFSISIPPESHIEVEARFTSKVTVYDTDLNDHIIYWYKYLVGTARYWNHSIDRAEFEFRIDKDDFTGTSMESRYTDWEIRETRTKVIFEKTYMDWTPESEYVGIAWQDNRSPIDILINNPSLLPLRIGILIFIIIVLLIIALILVRRKEKEKEKTDRS